jgi:hypothetical protein
MKTASITYMLRGALLLLAFSTTGCMGPARPFATSFAEVEKNEVILVGKIAIDPPLGEGDQTLKTVAFRDGGMIINPSAKDYRNKVLLLTNSNNRRVADPSMGDYRGRIEAALGETFYVRVPNEPFYVVRSEIWMDLKAIGMEKMVLPAGYRIDIRPGDRAVYVGTILYHRDEFFSTDKVKVVDEYKKESAAFRGRFGNAVKLRKAIVSTAP